MAMKYLVMQVTTNFAIASRYNAQLKLFHCLDNVSIEVQRILHYPAIWHNMNRSLHSITAIKQIIDNA